MPMFSIDHTYLAELQSAVGADELELLVEAMKLDATGLLDELQRAMDTGDAAALKRIAHRLAGVFSQFGATLIADAAERVRSIQSTSDLQTSGRELLELCHRALADLETTLASMASVALPHAA